MLNSARIMQLVFVGIQETNFWATIADQLPRLKVKMLDVQSTGDRVPFTNKQDVLEAVKRNFTLRDFTVGNSGRRPGEQTCRSSTLWNDGSYEPT